MSLESLGTVAPLLLVGRQFPPEFQLAVLVPPFLLAALLCGYLARGPKGLWVTAAASIAIAAVVGACWGVYFGRGMALRGTDGTEALMIWGMAPMVGLAIAAGAALGSLRWARGESNPLSVVATMLVLAGCAIPSSVVVVLAFGWSLWAVIQG